MNSFFMMSSENPPHFNGAYAEYYYLRPNHTVFKVPDQLTDDMVAPINCALSQVIQGFKRVDLKFGENVVIQGAGGLGIYATAVAKEMGANKVIVIDGIDDRLKLAKLFGADELIDMKTFKTPQERMTRVMELTNSQGADVVAELVGFANVIPEGIDLLGSGGRLLEIGNICIGNTFSYDPAMMVIFNKSIICVGYYDALSLKQALDLMFRTKDKYPYEKILSKTYPLEKIETAFKEQDQGLVQRAAIAFE